MVVDFFPPPVHWQKYFDFSTEPSFAEKVCDNVGLYLIQPDIAVMLFVGG